MDTYTIRHAYRSTRDGVQFGPWAAGDSVELDDATAEWLERDSPGLLVSPEPKRQMPPSADRQHRGGRNR